MPWKENPTQPIPEKPAGAPGRVLFSLWRAGRPGMGSPRERGPCLGKRRSSGGVRWALAGPWKSGGEGVNLAPGNKKKRKKERKENLNATVKIPCAATKDPKQPNKSVQFSRSVVSSSLQPHGLQHARPPYSSPTPGVYLNSCPLRQWCHLTISSSVVPFSSCSQSFPASGSFQMSQLFASGGQSIGVSASASVLPVNTQDWFPLVWTGWISLQSKGLSRVFFNNTVQKHQFFGAQLSL